MTDISKEDLRKEIDSELHTQRLHWIDLNLCYGPMK